MIIQGHLRLCKLILDIESRVSEMIGRNIARELSKTYETWARIVTVIQIEYSDSDDSKAYLSLSN